MLCNSTISYLTIWGNIFVQTKKQISEWKCKKAPNLYTDDNTVESRIPLNGLL